MPEPLAGSYGEFVRVVEARVVEVSLPVHLENRDEGIPIGNASPARVGVQVHAGQAERGGNERRGGLAVGPERLAVQEQLGVELPRAPAGEHLVAHRLLVHPEERGDGRQVGREPDDRADVQVAVRPAIQPVTDARRERVVHRRMAEGALDAEGAQSSLAVGEPRHADDRVRGQESHGDGGIVEVHLVGLQRIDGCLGQRVDVDLQPHRERGLRADAGTHAAERGALDGLVQQQRVAPESLVAERIEAEDVAPLAQPKTARAIVVPVVVHRRRRALVGAAGGRIKRGGVVLAAERAEQRDRERNLAHGVLPAAAVRPHLIESASSPR